MAKKKIMQANKESFGERLTRLRKSRGLTQTELAEQIGVTQRVITYYERETPFPPSEILPALAKALKTTTDNILGLEKNNDSENDSIPPRLLRKLKLLLQLPKQDQKAVVNYIDALSTKRRVKG